MNRQTQIYQWVKGSARCWTTSQLAAQLQLARPNVSKALNALVKQGKMCKSAGRPVQYACSVDLLQTHAAKKQKDNTAAKQQSDEPTPLTATTPQASATPAATENVFADIIGSSTSLKNQVEQGKAALLYPPHGLNTLIVGPTGSGKTYFANAMFQFAKQHKLLDKPELVTFNCADYAHNPQLLLSHLFGYVKGAFTGADSDQPGLIAAADGGMLFLDEVHRLPPEGQEMIFYLLDNGTYSRMGETAKTRHANIRLVCATTEDPGSTLLQTFVRRIPITIQLPAFKERPLKEQYLLLRQLLTAEAKRIHRKIQVDEDVVQALLGSVTFGNVGQLKSNIQLVCARGFIDQLDKTDLLHLRFHQLPEAIAQGVAAFASDRKQISALSRLLPATVLVSPDDQLNEWLPTNDNYELPYNLYELIGTKAALLKQDGLKQADINHYIMTDINVHLKSLYRPDESQAQMDERLAELLTPDLMAFTKEIEQLLQEKHYPIRSNFVYALGLHISSFLQRLQAGKPLRPGSPDLTRMAQGYPKEMEYARLVKEKLVEKYGVTVPAAEVDYLAVLLVSLRSEAQNGKIGVVVAAHGNSTASSMAQVVTQLLGVDNLAAFDMPLSMSPKIALAGIAKKVKEVDKGNGVVVLVDMGSLASFEPQLRQLTQIAVAVVPMVTTALVFEAARKTSMIQTKLPTLVAELRDFSGYSNSKQPEQHAQQPAAPVAAKATAALRPLAIVAVCSSGAGTAAKIKKLLTPEVNQCFAQPVSIIPASLVNLEQQVQTISRNYRIIASVGLAALPNGVPHLELEGLLLGQAPQFLAALKEKLPQPAAVTLPPRDLLKTTTEMLTRDYTFLNPTKIAPILVQYTKMITAKIELSFTHQLNLVMHMAGCVERSLQRQPLTATAEQIAASRHNQAFAAVMAANEWLQQQLGCEVVAAETYYIVNVIAPVQPTAN